MNKTKKKNSVLGLLIFLKLINSFNIKNNKIII